MREVCLGLAVACATAVQVITAQEMPAPQVMAGARAALGGNALDGIRTLRIRGRATRAIGALAVASEVEIRIAMPDRYLRIDRMTLGGVTSEMASGFAGASLIQRATAPGGRVLDPLKGLTEAARPAATAASLRALRQDALLLLLGLFAQSSDALPVTVGDGGIAESADRRAHVVTFDDDRGFSGRFLVDTSSHLPIFASWVAPDTATAMQRLVAAGRPGAPPPTPDALIAGIDQVEHRLYFLDYRPEGRATWPHLLRRAVGGTTMEEIAVDGFAINYRFPSDAFAPQP